MLRGFLVSAIYDRTFTIDVAATQDTGAVTLMSADIERIANGMKSIHELWANIVEVAIGVYLLQNEIGFAFLSTLVVIIGSSSL